MFCIYCHTSPSGKRYVGWTSMAPRVRWLKHVSAARRGSTNPFHNAIRKHGAAAFTHAVLERMSTLAGVLRSECLWIERLGTFGPGGYNASRGGEGQSGSRHSESTLAKMRAAWTPERRTQQRLRVIGRAHSSEARQKIRAALVGRSFTAAHRDALSEGRKGMRLAPEHRAKIGEASKRAWAERRLKGYT